MFLSRLNEISAGCEKIVPVSESSANVAAVELRFWAVVLAKN